MKMILLTILFLAAGLKAHAALNWQAPKIESTAEAGAERFTHAFVFKNTGDEPVNIKAIKSSCGCTTGKLDKRTFAPGEEGQLNATFTFGSRTGEQIKTITVETDEPNSRPTVLTMKVTIPDFATVTPQHVFWNRDEEPAAKSVQISAGALGPVTVTSVIPQNDQIQAQLVPMKADDGSRYYEVLLTPHTTQAPLETNIRIDVKAESGQSKTLWTRAGGFNSEA